MKLDRTTALAVTLIGVIAVGVVAALAWPSSKPSLACPPEDVRLIDGGAGPVAVCAPGTPKTPMPIGQAMTLGVKVDLNRVSEAELARVPGVGPQLARTLVQERERRGGFKTWDEVDGVRGVGAARLEALQQALELRP